VRRIAFWSLALVLAWTVSFLVNASAYDSDLYWTVEQYRAKQAISETLPGPHRILLAGGSHTHYSLSALAIEAQTQCPTVNLGLHAGLGLGVLLDITSELARAGDLVVLTPEYGILTGTGSNWLAAGFGAATFRIGIGGRGLRERARLAFAAGTSTFTTVGKTVWTLATGERGRADPRAGPRGDAVAFLYDRQAVPEVAMRDRVSPQMLIRLSEFRDSLAARGSAVIFNLPALLSKEGDDITRESAMRVAQQLSAIAPVITHGETFNIQTDSRLFSDSSYHLTPGSRAVQSDRLGSRLQVVVQSLGWSCERLSF
jgi:hypothetical protein